MSFLRTASIFAAVGITASLAAASPAVATPAPTDIPAQTTTGPCAYSTTPEEAASSVYLGLPQDPTPTPATGTVTVNISTNHGEIPVVMERHAAPCTVQSMVHLITQKLYNNTTCHRLTAYDRLSVLQCGDPKGTGEGGPGYSFKDELPTWQEPWPGAPAGKDIRKYSRGTLAMANAGPNTNGSQFFMVYKDSGLPPLYTVYGRVSDEGLKVLDAIAAGGIVPSERGAQDGAPKLPVQVTSVRIVESR